MSRGGVRSAIGLILAILAPSSARADDAKIAPADVEFFEAKVRPVLSARCFECHGDKKQKGGLRLDSPGAMRAGGDSGPAIMPGDPANSPLVEAIRYEAEIKMPP